MTAASDTGYETQWRIVHALQAGPLNQYQIAADICQAAFRVDAELKVLVRERLVHRCSDGLCWLTLIGRAAAERTPMSAGASMTSDNDT